VEDWRRIIDEAADLGVEDVQFIGGEPTLLPELPGLVQHAVRHRLAVEIYSNLARPISDELWRIFGLRGVRLATSYHAANHAIHDRLTTRLGSHKMTRANIIQARRRGVPLRVGVVAVGDGVDATSAVADLASLGVVNVKVDRLRQVGRGVRDSEPGVKELCGRCAESSLAVLPTGDVLPCVFARWLRLGNARTTSLSEINEAADAVRADLRSNFVLHADECDPKKNECDPTKKDGDPHGCDPEYKQCDPWKNL